MHFLPRPRHEFREWPARGLQIGIISHVESLKERIPAQIRVDKGGGVGHSRLTVLTRRTGTSAIAIVCILIAAAMPRDGPSRKRPRSLRRGP